MLEVIQLFGRFVIKNSEANDAIDETTDIAKTAQKKISDAFDKIGHATVVVGKAIATGLAAGATAVGALVKESVEGYAEYEQLVGGSQLLFGDAYDYIAEKASDAYRTVQMSQSEYLKQVNGFATGLKTALGGDAKAAAELADRIITAEADIVAATGNSKEAVQNAFNGIMKSNFTMLDNLQLGITPTKEGFQEVIDKVNEWNEVNGKATDYQIENLADCQSALLDYVEMQGLSGYAADEASRTIQGSISMVKSSWKNLITGMSDENADFEVLVNNFVESVGITAENIIPRIEIALEGAGKLVDELVPIIIDKVPQIVGDMLPKILKSGEKIIKSIVQGITENQDDIADSAVDTIVTLTDGIVDMLPDIIVTGALLIGKLAVGLIEAIPDLVEKIPEIVDALIEGFQSADFAEIGIRIVNGIWEGIIATWNMLVSNFSWLTDALLAGANALSGMSGDALMGASVSQTVNTTTSGSTSSSGNGLSGIHSSNVELYASGAVLNEPTAFAINPYTGKTMVGGESGAEAIAPISTLQQYVKAAVQDENMAVVESMERIVDLLVGFFPDALEAMRTPMVCDTNGLAVAMAPAMNTELGRIAIKKGRGR